jgi:hypothetical protein
MNSLLSAAVEPLADHAEYQQAASSILAETSDPSHPAAASTATRLSEIHHRKFPLLWPILLGLAAAVAILSAVTIQMRDMHLLPLLSNDTFAMLDIKQEKSHKDITREQQLILGEPGLTSWERARKLHEFAPDNPAYYAEYIAAFTHDHDGSSLPPDYFETVQRIAPNNSFFLYWAAGKIGGDSLEKNSEANLTPEARYREGVRLGPLPTEKEFTIRDQAAFDEAIALLDKASALPDFNSYTRDMLIARASLVPYDNFADYIASLTQQYSAPSTIIGLRKVSDLLSAQAQSLSHQKEREKFIRLTEIRKHFLESQASNPDVYLINELVFSVSAYLTSQYFHWAAERLGLDDISEVCQQEMLAFQEQKDQRDIRSKKEYSDLFTKRSSMLSHLSLAMVDRQASSPPPLSDGDLKPLRLVDHDIASRFGITCTAWFFAFACLPVFLFRFFYPPPVRVTAIHLAKLLRPADWTWIIGIGIILPIALYLTINRLTPLGGRAYGIQAFLFHFPAIHLAAILLSLLLAPAVLIRWRLSIRLDPFGIPARPGMMPIMLLALLLVWALSAFPILEHIDMRPSILIAMATIPSLCVGYPLFSLLRKPASRIARTAISAALLPAYAVAIPALCLTIPLFTASEEHWIKQDTLFRINPDAPNLGAYEFRVATQRRKETNAILGL